MNEKVLNAVSMLMAFFKTLIPSNPYKEATKQMKEEICASVSYDVKTRKVWGSDSNPTKTNRKNHIVRLALYVGTLGYAKLPTTLQTFANNSSGATKQQVVEAFEYIRTTALNYVLDNNSTAVVKANGMKLFHDLIGEWIQTYFSQAIEEVEQSNAVQFGSNNIVDDDDDDDDDFGNNEPTPTPTAKATEPEQTGFFINTIAQFFQMISTFDISNLTPRINAVIDRLARPDSNGDVRFFGFGKSGAVLDYNKRQRLGIYTTKMGKTIDGRSSALHLIVADALQIMPRRQLTDAAKKLLDTKKSNATWISSLVKHSDYNIYSQRIALIQALGIVLAENIEGQYSKRIAPMVSPQFVEEFKEKLGIESLESDLLTSNDGWAWEYQEGNKDWRSSNNSPITLDDLLNL